MKENILFNLIIFGIKDRVKKGLDFLVTNHKKDDKILVVSHGIALEAIFACINNEGVETFSERKVPENTSLTIVEYKDNQFKILGRIEWKKMFFYLLLFQYTMLRSILVV